MRFSVPSTLPARRGRRSATSRGRTSGRPTSARRVCTAATSCRPSRRTSASRRRRNRRPGRRAHPTWQSTEAALRVCSTSRERFNSRAPALAADCSPCVPPATCRSITRRRVSGPNIKPDANLRRTDLSGYNLTGVDLAGADLRGSNLKGTTLVGTKLATANLAGVSAVDITGAHLRRCPRDGALFPGLPSPRTPNPRECWSVRVRISRAPTCRAWICRARPSRA